MGGPCDYCVSPVQRIGFLGFFDFLDLRVRIWGLLGQGIGDLDSGLTISKDLMFASVLAVMINTKLLIFLIHIIC